MDHTPAPRANRISPGQWTLTSMLAALAFVLAACAPGATASTSGEGPASSALGAEVRMGPVEVATSDIEGLHSFYGEGVGLTTISSDTDEVRLGTDGTELIRLIAADSPDAAADDPTQAGLYHSAFLFADAKELAASVLRTASLAPASFAGSSDHKVSHAFYFADPEGNGVELYADTPEETWEWNDGLVVMGSATLDPNAYIAEHLGNQEPAPSAEGVSMGHVHLRGGDLQQADEFYADGLGFAVTSRAQGAVFMAAGGYHHHLAVNTWSSAGAGERPESLGLRSVSIVVPDQAELEAIAARLDENQIQHKLGNGSLATSDPWGTRIMVRVAD